MSISAALNQSTARETMVHSTKRGQNTMWCVDLFILVGFLPHSYSPKPSMCHTANSSWRTLPHSWPDKNSIGNEATANHILMAKTTLIIQ